MSSSNLSFGQFASKSQYALYGICLSVELISTLIIVLLLQEVSIAQRLATKMCAIHLKLTWKQLIST